MFLFLFLYLFEEEEKELSFSSSSSIVIIKSINVSNSSSSEVEDEVEVEVNERAKHYFTKDSFYEHADKLYSSFQNNHSNAKKANAERFCWIIGTWRISTRN